MRIPATTESFESVAWRYHPTGRMPVTKTEPKGDFRQLAYWISDTEDGGLSEKGRQENSLSQWKFDGILIYLNIMREFVGLGGSFPCIFELLDGIRIWPDHAIVKLWLRDGYIEDFDIDGELCFSLTESGRRMFSIEASQSRA